MKAILYDVHSYERAAFDRANGAKTHQLTYVSGRGPLVDTTALLDALKRDHLGGVGLDVYEREAGVFYADLSEQGLTDDVLAHLLSFPRVIVTSHVGYLTWEALGEIAATTLANLTEFEHGKKLTHELKPTRAG